MTVHGAVSRKARGEWERKWQLRVEGGNGKGNVTGETLLSIILLAVHNSSAIQSHIFVFQRQINVRTKNRRQSSPLLLCCTNKAALNK